jgi:hypothetical protein
METITTIVIVLFFSIPSVLLMVFGVEMHFLKFKIENHPALTKMAEDVLYNICEQEGIKVFHKSYQEINVGRTKENGAVGMYIYTTDGEYQQTVNKCLREIESMEQEYRLPYKNICALVGHESTVDKEDFVLPKILLAQDSLKAYGLTSYYDTFFHELGHHFAVKEMGEHNEEDANRYGAMLARKYLPSYFFLFHGFKYRFASDANALTTKEKIKAYYEYLLYLKNNRNDSKKVCN